MGIDGAWLNGHSVLVAVDMGDGEPIAIDSIDEKDMAAVRSWLKALKEQQSQAQRDGIGAIVTDDLSMYRRITEKLGLGHQVCQFHVRRWVGKACRELSQSLPEEWLWMVEQIKVIKVPVLSGMEDLSLDGD